MAGLAALRAGAGLVTVACPKSVQPLVAAYAPELMTEPLEETSEGTVSLLTRSRTNSAVSLFRECQATTTDFPASHRSRVSLRSSKETVPSEVPPAAQS